MLRLFSSVKRVLKVDDVQIDNHIFRLHYKVTMGLLMICSLMNTATQYFGSPIDCVVKGVPRNIVNTFCWFSSTFTLPNRAGRIGVDLIQPGVGNYVTEEDDIRYHAYYQWVCFVLSFQAVLFYVPRYIWKYWEGGRARALTRGLRFISFDEAAMNARVKILINYFVGNLNQHDFYFVKYVTCEILNMFNVLGQCFLMDSFLGKQFTTYGWDTLNVMDQEQGDRSDPMSTVFPKMTKCDFYKYGSSGTIQKFDGLCILPLNAVNEKIYVTLWFWFIILMIFSSAALVYRALLILNSRLRYYLLSQKFRSIPRKDLEFMCKKLRMGDWFMIYQISHNIDPIAFNIFVADFFLQLQNMEEIAKVVEV